MDPSYFLATPNQKGPMAVVGADIGQEVSKMMFAQQNLHDVPLARLQQISSTDREEHLYDVHGVLKPFEETPELIATKMAQLRLELVHPHLQHHEETGGGDDVLQMAAVTPQRYGYELALQQSPDFVDRQLLCFLRANSFNVKRAAAHCLRHFDTKLELFGTEKVGKELELKDLDEVDREALEAGAIQVLRRKDQSGRAIIAQFPKVARKYPIDVVSKLILWAGTVASREEEVQKRGIVYIYFEIGIKEILDMNILVRRGPQNIRAILDIPAKVVALHGCSDSLNVKEPFSAFSTMIETQFLCRFQTHFGSSLECQYSLMTFGIPVSTLPVRDGDDACIDLTGQKLWIQELEAQEAAQKETTVIIEPTSCHENVKIYPSALSPPKITQLGPFDVIMGRGPRGAKYPGNVRFKRILEQHRSDYEAAGRRYKAAIAKEVYTEMHLRGSRFVAPATMERKPIKDIGAWIEVGETEALQRIGHGFRNLKHFLLLKKKG